MRAVEACTGIEGEKYLLTQEIQLLFNEGLSDMFYRCLFATALFNAARINEVCTLQNYSDTTEL